MKTFKKSLLNYILPIIIVIVIFSVPLFSVSFDINTILTVISLIFAILVGFFVAASTTNYLNLQTFISEEDGSLINLYNLVKIVQPGALNTVREKIDYYVTKTLDFSIKDYVSKTQKEFKDIQKEIDNISPNDERGIALIPTLHDEKNILFKSRQKISLAAQNIVMASHWIILILLAALIVGLILSIRDGEILTNIIVAVLALSIYYILLLLYKIDSNIFLEELLAFQNSQIIFSELETLKYFPLEGVNNKKVRRLKEDYRVGIYKGIPGESEREIRIIERS